ncbi:enoyl-CoA hydratase/isomerase family protein [Emcibacter sp. SYSU 3D8]|uniref:enoyl-CoA hydratase/isomerase family protein n=1 Tax=Emcibacter sp. SYSU 3D8 TaxID=3133969 RepID=UPI0031FE55A1
MGVVTLEWPADGVALVTMTNPAINNHGSWAGIHELWQTLVKAREDGARVTVLASGVPGHWFEHAWLRDMLNMFQGKEVSGPADGWFGCINELSKSPVVSIAAISGDTSGGGCEIGWACDLRVAEEQVYFSQPEVRIGVGTGIGGASRLVRLIGRTVAAEMVLDGGAISAQRLYELGGINKVVPQGTALEAVLAWATRLAGHPPDALAGMKRMLAQAEENPLTEAIKNDQRIFQEFSGKPAALARMEEVQAKFDAGAGIRETYWLGEIEG